MKILHINSNYFYSKLHKELKEYLDLKNINTVFSPIIKNAKNIKLIDSSAIAPVSFNKIDRLFFYHKQSKIFNSLYKNLEVTNYNLVHAHTLFTDGNVAYNLKNKFDIPYVVSVRNTDINIFFKKRLSLRRRGMKILEDASAVIFLSSNYKDQLLRRYIKSDKLKIEIEKKSFIIPNGVNDFWFENLNCPKSFDSSKLNIIYVGRIDNNKNLSTTAEALRILNKNNINVSYNIVGKNHNNKLFSRLKEYNFINFHGELEPEKLIDEYRANDIFIMPSIYETFGLVYVEALTQGLPVIYSKGQGFDNQFRDGTVGFSVNKLDEKDIINKIKLIIKNYDEISANAVKFSKEFQWSKIANDYTHVYNEVMRKI